MAGKPQHDWPDDDALVAIIADAGNVSEAARRMGIARPTVVNRIAARGLEARVREVTQSQRPVTAVDPEMDQFPAGVHALVKRKKRISVEAIADELDCSPRRVRDALATLRANGYRVPEERGEVALAAVEPDKLNLHRLDPQLLDGDELVYGLVSDTHLASREEALEELHLAYDVFEREGIQRVFHAGDFTCGYGIFRTQASEVKRHTFESQVDYLVDNYPHRPGVVTEGISGNHDVEGDFGKIGANPVVAMAARRPDVRFLGDYSAWVELPNGAWLHLLHGKGGMSYAYSYKAQKLVDGYPSGRKPAILHPGHWHVSGWIEQRAVHVVWPACFEWRSPFLARLGLSPSVGFWIVRATLGDDGSLVRFRPEFHRFHEGRHMTAAAA